MGFSRRSALLPSPTEGGWPALSGDEFHPLCQVERKKKIKKKEKKRKEKKKAEWASLFLGSCNQRREPCLKLGFTK
jgi:hypothetical protein